MIRCAVLAAVLLLTGCAKHYECVTPTEERPHSLPRIGCNEDYRALWSQRQDAIFSRTRTINWLIDREDNRRLYFIQTEDWDLHYRFAHAFLNHPDRSPVGTHADFNRYAYYGKKRRFVLGKLIHYVDQELLTFEMATGDDADIEMIVAAFEDVRGALYNGADLRYRPVSSNQETKLPILKKRIPVIKTETVYRGQKYQPLHQRVGYGTLRFVRVDALAQTKLRPTDIVVLDRVPNDISLVSGIITDDFQTPLAHINILSKNRGIPNMALRGAFSLAKLRALEGKLVRLTVARQRYDLRRADPKLAKQYWESLQPKEPLVPRFSLQSTSIVDLADAEMDSFTTIGAKAANLAELGKISDPTLRLPAKAFALPFSFYDEHLNKNGVRPLISKLLRQYEEDKINAKRLSEALFEIRWKIYVSPLSGSLRDEVVKQIRQRWGDKRIRFRSSTNVEDLPEFSGAGLYTSAGAELKEGSDAIENAIKVVWASTWNEQAFIERAYYRVDQSNVFMGVLIHPAFRGELANGVIVTANTYTHRRPALYINSQVGEASVTNPAGQATSEQILYYTWYEVAEYEVITRSSLLPRKDWPAGTAVLTKPELDKLAVYAQAIHKHFRTRLGGDEKFAMDIEYKLAPGREVYIKQARPLKQR